MRKENNKMKEEIIEVLKQVKAGVNYENEKNLVSDGILESFDIVTLISLLNNKFGVFITVTDLVPENFESVEAMEQLINKLK